MPGLRRAVSSLGALASFEAAARHLSFTRAAGELGVTQAAVSRQIKLLEAELNTPLFQRGHRRVTLTPAGALLAQSLTGAFDGIADTIEAIRRPVSTRTVTVGATLGFAHFWLLPRLPRFRAEHPNVQLRLVSQDTVFDPVRDPLDVLVQYGRAGARGARILASMPDRVFPVCAPALRNRLGEDLAALPLIGADWVEPSWLTWRRWSALAGVALNPNADALRFSHYTDAIYAAIGGEGVALGWSTLVGPLLAEGRLVRLGQLEVTPDEHHCLLVPETRAPTRAAQAFIDWMVAGFAASGVAPDP